MQQSHIIEYYIVEFWLNDHFGYTTTQRDGSYKIKLWKYADFGSLTYTLITYCFYFNEHYSISAVTLHTYANPKSSNF